MFGIELSIAYLFGDCHRFSSNCSLFAKSCSNGVEKWGFVLWLGSRLRSNNKNFEDLRTITFLDKSALTFGLKMPRLELDRFFGEVICCNGTKFRFD